jgi:hypothetical protein
MIGEQFNTINLPSCSCALPVNLDNLYTCRRRFVVPIQRVISINSIDSTMEPIFAESASETVTAELRAQLDAAIAALPPAHCLNPTENELSDS